MMNKVKFPKEVLQDLPFYKEYDGYKLVYSNIVDTTRWSNVYEMVFEYDNKYYMTSYSVGATECQDEGPYEFEPDEIECIEVYPREKTVVVYEQV